MVDVVAGGWTGSTYFSKVMTPANQDAFVQACVDAVSTYDLDGQYPLLYASPHLQLTMTATQESTLTGYVAAMRGYMHRA